MWKIFVLVFASWILTVDGTFAGVSHEEMQEFLLLVGSERSRVKDVLEGEMPLVKAALASPNERERAKNLENTRFRHIPPSDNQLLNDFVNIERRYSYQLLILESIFSIRDTDTYSLPILGLLVMELGEYWGSFCYLDKAHNFKDGKFLELDRFLPPLFPAQFLAHPFFEDPSNKKAAAIMQSVSERLEILSSLRFLLPATCRMLMGNDIKSLNVIATSRETLLRKHGSELDIDPNRVLQKFVSRPDFLALRDMVQNPEQVVLYNLFHANSMNAYEPLKGDFHRLAFYLRHMLEPQTVVKKDGVLVGREDFRVLELMDLYYKIKPADMNPYLEVGNPLYMRFGHLRERALAPLPSPQKMIPTPGRKKKKKKTKKKRPPVAAAAAAAAAEDSATSSEHEEQEVVLLSPDAQDITPPDLDQVEEPESLAAVEEPESLAATASAATPHAASGGEAKTFRPLSFGGRLKNSFLNLFDANTAFFRYADLAPLFNCVGISLDSSGGGSHQKCRHGKKTLGIIANHHPSPAIGKAAIKDVRAMLLYGLMRQGESLDELDEFAPQVVLSTLDMSSLFKDHQPID